MLLLKNCRFAWSYDGLEMKPLYDYTERCFIIFDSRHENLDLIQSFHEFFSSAE